MILQGVTWQCRHSQFKSTTTRADSTIDSIISATHINSINHHYTSPNEILSKTVLTIKTYNRNQCLTTLLNSVADNAPWIHVIVADDSTESVRSIVESVEGFDHSPVYIRLPVDSGVGYGRQRLVQKASELGFEYLIMSDDDFVISNRDLIPRMAQALIDLKADVLAPMRCEVIVKPQQISGQERWDGKWDNYLGCGRGEIAALVRSRKNELIVLPKVTFPYKDDISSIHPVLLSSTPKSGSIGARYDCHRSDLVQQFFLGRVSKLVESGWDDVLKNNDHYDAMLSMKKNNMRLYICRELKISHNAQGCTKHELSVRL